MYASTQKQPVTYSWLFRNCGRIGGVIVMAAWLALVVNDLFRQGAPAPDAYLQAGALAIVFVGYVIGWKKEMLGGVLAVLGTIAFYIVNLVVFHAPPLPEAALLAVPGIFYMLAQGVEEHPGGGVRESHEH